MKTINVKTMKIAIVIALISILSLIYHILTHQL